MLMKRGSRRTVGTLADDEASSHFGIGRVCVMAFIPLPSLLPQLRLVTSWKVWNKSMFILCIRCSAKVRTNVDTWEHLIVPNISSYCLTYIITFIHTLTRTVIL